MQSSKVKFMNDPVQFKSLEIIVDRSGSGPVLKITGALFLPELCSDLQLMHAIPQGINPKELLLEFHCNSRCPVTKYVSNPFVYTAQLRTRHDYTSVKLIYDGWISESFAVS